MGRPIHRADSVGNGVSVIFAPTSIEGVLIVEPEKRVDDRGYFARTWCAREFAAHGIHVPFVQANSSFNRRRGTLRGMHFDEAPFEEIKLVRCTRGALFDVAIDLRRHSPTYRHHVAITLTPDAANMLYIPWGCAHGFLTLADDTEVTYLMAPYYVPRPTRGVRWNDPAFGIEWPRPVAVISERDAAYPDYSDEIS
jgi:dTDP-4-dehydrorhamnose 3,5-epimerase